MSLYKNEPSIVYYVLSVLSKCPISSRNKIEEAGIDVAIESLFEGQKPPDENSDKYALYQLSRSLLDKWNLLPRIFKIPKRTHQLDEIATPFSTSVSEKPPTPSHIGDRSQRPYNSNDSPDTRINTVGEGFFAQPASNGTSQWDDGGTNLSWDNTQNYSTGWGNAALSQEQPNKEVAIFSYSNNLDGSSSAVMTNSESIKPFFTRSPCSPSQHSGSSDLFSNLMDNTLNSLKRHHSKAPDIAISQRSEKNVKKPPHLHTGGNSAADCPTSFPDSTNVSQTICDDKSFKFTSPQTSVLISPIQLQHIIRKATISASINSANQMKHFGDGNGSDTDDDGHGSHFSRAGESPATGVYRTAWMKLLKTLVCSDPSNFYRSPILFRQLLTDIRSKWKLTCLRN